MSGPRLIVFAFVMIGVQLRFLIRHDTIPQIVEYPTISAM